METAFGLGVASPQIGRGDSGLETDCPVVVADGFFVAAQGRAGAGRLEIEPGIVGVEADRLGGIGGRLLEALQIGAVGTDAGRAGGTA